MEQPASQVKRSDASVCFRAPRDSGAVVVISHDHTSELCYGADSKPLAKIQSCNSNAPMSTVPSPIREYPAPR